MTGVRFKPQLESYESNTLPLLLVWSVTHGCLITVWRHSSTMSFIGWMCQRWVLKIWVSWCTAVFTVRHLGTSPTISSHPPTSLLGFVYVPQTDTSSSYLAVVSTHTAVGRFRSLVRRYGSRNWLPNELRDPASGSDSFKQFLKTILFSLY